MARRSKKTLNLDLEGQPDPKAPLDWQQFLASAQPVLKLLKDDLRARAKASASVRAALEARHADEKAQKRTADSFLEWQDHFVEQVAAAWMLSCVFVRTLEDRGLLGHNRLAGPGASDSLKLFLDLAPSLNERDYLLTIFRELTRFAATRDLFDARHNPVWLLTPSAEGAKALVQLFQQPRAELPAFRFGQSDTGFLGWIYQDLDEGVRARFALLQTPRFIESFILDRTLEPAIEKFGLDDTTLIDPTCGSGHFLLGAFERLLEHRLQKEPGLSAREAARRALDAVYGADINPYAVAIARFRLTLAFFDKAGFARLSDAPALPLHVVVADSLLHNPHLEQGHFGDLATSIRDWKGEEFALESETEARDVLHRQFAAVVGNPPYIVANDSALNAAYRKAYKTARGQYQLSVPFTERLFQLARPAGFVGAIVSNGFMKREFGEPLVEDFFPRVNLTLIVNTSGAFVPGHGTPTVMLFGTQEDAHGTHVHSVLAKRGEPATPADPERGNVWSSIQDHWKNATYEDEYISVTDVDRPWLERHPWILAGGGAIELVKLMEQRSGGLRLKGLVDGTIGRAARTGEDTVYMYPRHVAARLRLDDAWWMELLIGENVRDWATSTPDMMLFPYDRNGSLTAREITGSEARNVLRILWPYRRRLANRATFSGKMNDAGLAWHEYMQYTPSANQGALSIAFAFVATHNHFVLDRGGKVFNRSAPIIKLPATATEDDHLALLAYLNSSTACFWMKQVCHNKTNASQKHHTDPARAAYEFAGTALEELPIPSVVRDASLVAPARELLHLAEQRAAWVSGQILAKNASELRSDGAIRDVVAQGWNLYDEQTRRAAYLQEEIDWRVYAAFGLIDIELGSIEPNVTTDLGGRPFEIHSGYSAGVSERAQRSDQERKSVSTPSSWRSRVPHLQDDGIRVIEAREFKRVWRDTEQNVDQLDFRRGLPGTWLREMMLEELEIYSAKSTQPISVGTAKAGLAPLTLNAISEFLAVAAPALVEELLGSAAVPFLAAIRYTDSGLDRHAEWQRTWDLQRREDAGEKIASIPVPPKYAQGDYHAPTYWQLRGPLDVPKERFIAYPGCESDQDGEPIYGWAGWDHEQRAKALATLYWNRKTEESWSKERLTPMLAGLLELLPWLKQWHVEPSDEYAGDSAANYYAGFLDAECRAFGLTHDDLRAWRPAEKARGKRGSKTRNAVESVSPADGTPTGANDNKPKRRARKRQTDAAPGGQP